MYIEPSFHFTFYGFEWVKPIEEYTYILFLICGISAFFVAIGYKYYLSIITFFLSFTYIELMDKTTYLNHYYFVSILSFLMIFLPANSSYSMDSYLSKKSQNTDSFTFVFNYDLKEVKNLNVSKETFLNFCNKNKSINKNQENFEEFNYSEVVIDMDEI